jgi:hypothetical protein
MPKKAIRPIRISGQVAYVPLTKGYEAIIDAKDVDIVCKFNWMAYEKKNTVYAVRNDPEGTALIRLHRLIMNAPKGLEVDHIDRNGLNNTRENLRICDRCQNMRNVGPRDSKGTKGISWHKRTGKWQARIVAGGAQIYLGVYETEQMAQNAYNDACIRLHGDFAVTC